MKIYNTVFFLLFCFFIGSNIFCAKAPAPRVDFPDLSCLGLVPAQIIVGQPFDVDVQISNNITTIGAETLPANANSLFVELYLKDALGGWGKIYELVIPVTEIKAGTKTTVKVPMLVNSPGEYRLNLFIDSKNQVEERSEANNKSDIFFKPI